MLVTKQKLNPYKAKRVVDLVSTDKHTRLAL